MAKQFKPPNRVYVIFDVESGRYLAVVLTEPKELFEGEIVYRYERWKGKKRD